MKIDHQYLRDLLLTFELTEGPDTMLNELVDKGYSLDSQEFIFHMRLLSDNGLIQRVDGQSGFGHVLKTYSDGYDYIWIETPLRLTAAGHNFIADLRQKDVWETIKTNFRDEGVSTLVSLSRQLAEAFAKKKIKEIIGLEI